MLVAKIIILMERWVRNRIFIGFWGLSLSGLRWGFFKEGNRLRMGKFYDMSWGLMDIVK